MVFVFTMCRGNTQKYSNPVFIHPDSILDAAEEKNGTVKSNDDETLIEKADKESLKDESGVDL